MHDKSSDTTVPLEWDTEGKYWTFPLLEHEWAEFRGLLGYTKSNYIQIEKDNYHIEKNPNGEYRVLWTAPEHDRPQKAYGLVAVRPKKPGTVLGIPLPVVIPIVTALAGALGAILVDVVTQNPPPIEEICSESKEWVAAVKMKDCKSQLKKVTISNEALESCRQEEKVLYEFAMRHPSQDRVLYLLGRSHGQRLEAIKRLPGSIDTARDIALQAEKEYVENVLLGDTSSLSFSKGKARGQEESIKLLGVGEPQIITGTELSTEFRR